jgi:hypothetical protein
VRIVAVLLLLLVSIAHADPLDDAKRLEAQLDFEPALLIVEKLINDGGNDRAHLVELHLFAGKLAAGLDKRDVAEDHFARAISLAPSTTLPEGISPKIALPFAAARAHSGPLRITDSGQVESDPMNLVATIQSEGLMLSTLVAVDIHGNVLWTQPHRSGPHRDFIVDDSPKARRHRRRFAIAAGISLATFVTTGIAMWRFNHAQDEWSDLKVVGMTDYTELKSVEQRGRRWGFVANAGIAASIVMTALTLTVAW